MQLSIIILNYKTKGLVKQCIRNVQVSTNGFACLPVGRDYEIIVVDNNSNDGIKQMIDEKFPNVKFVQTGANLGFAAGNNAGMRIAKGKYILILNPDVTVLNNSLEKMVKYMEENSEVGIAGPKLINPDGSYQISCRTFQDPKLILYRRTPLGLLPFAQKQLKKHLMLDFDHNQIKEVDWFLGACMLIRKSALDQVGLFDERFFMYLEDMDLCRRFWQKGYKVVYLADIEVVHLYERASANDSWNFLKLNKLTRIHIHSGIKYFLKYQGNIKYDRTRNTTK